MRRSTALYLSLLIIFIAVVDGFFKYFAISRLPVDGSRLIWPIDLALHKNPGIAFDIPIPLTIVIVLTLLIVIFLGKFLIEAWKHDQYRNATLALAITIGALGNMFDRILNGFTTDYIILFGRSAINLADILIVLGALGLLLYNRSKDKK